MRHEQNGLAPLRTVTMSRQAMLATVLVGNIYTICPRPPARRKLVQENALVFIRAGMSEA
jgi:hypothetical protein